MAHVSLLLPSIKINNLSYEEISQDIYMSMGFKPSDIEIFRLVPMTNEDNFNKSEINENYDPNEIAIRVHSVNINLRVIEQIIKQRDNMKEQLSKTNEALKTYLQELQKMRKYFSIASESEEKETKNKYYK